MTSCATKDLEIGTTARIATTLKEQKVLTDPTTVVLRVKPPTGATTTPTVVRDSVGAFHGDVVVNKAGQWRFRWESTGPTSAEEGSFVVRKSSVV